MEVELSERRAGLEDGVVRCAACRKTLPHELHARAEAIDGAKAVRHVGFVFSFEVVFWQDFVWVLCCEQCRETLVSRSAEPRRRRGD